MTQHLSGSNEPLDGMSKRFEVLYEDNHLLGIVKPVNIPVQEDATGDPDLLNLLKEDVKALVNVIRIHADGTFREGLPILRIGVNPSRNQVMVLSHVGGTQLAHRVDALQHPGADTDRKSVV